MPPLWYCERLSSKISRFSPHLRTTSRDSDIDILVEFEPGAEGTIYEYVRLKEFVASLFDGPVDVIDRDALKPHLRAPATRDTLYAF